ncbi:MAG: CDP-alcohol phosphatidyltransferase family protein [Actinomycetota bacterium]
MIDAKLRGLWDRVMRPIGRALGATGVSPDVITLLGVSIQAVAAVQILQGELLVAGLVGVGAAIADGFDGAVAKAQGRTSRFGALLDSTTDRVTDALFLIPVVWLYGVAPDVPERDQPWVAAVTLLAFVAGFLVSYVKARAEALGFECKVGIAERAERVILILVGLLFDVLPVTITILAALSVVTFVHRVVHVRRQPGSV